jgi:hypothetical protein
MSTINPIWLEGRRRYWQRHDWQRFIRHDAHRFLTPAGIAEEKRAAEAEQAAQREAEAAAAAEHETFYAEHLELRRQLADVKFELAFRRIFRKYSPDQPRDELGRWTDAGGGANTGASDDGAPGGSALSDATPDPVRGGDHFAKVIPICMLGSHGTSMDQWRNRSWYAEYVCADGFTFRKSGPGDRIRPFWRDPR